ncbi:MAG: hypothetical protein IJ877_03010 [Candidatus Gastranaerophilales bacterium]|nr:hypothetical protein [Candidatus Gastranaerophilales bacterium]
MKKFKFLLAASLLLSLNVFAMDTYKIPDETNTKYEFDIYQTGESYSIQGVTYTGVFDITEEQVNVLIDANNTWGNYLNAIPQEIVKFSITSLDEYNAAAYSPIIKVNESPYKMTWLNQALNNHTLKEGQTISSPSPVMMLLGLGIDETNPGWDTSTDKTPLYHGSKPSLQATMLHEVVHALGINSNSYPFNGDNTFYFSRAEGDPLNIYDANLAIYKGDIAAGFNSASEIKAAEGMTVGADKTFDNVNYSPYFTGENTIKVIGGKDNYDEAKQAIVDNGGILNYSAIYYDYNNTQNPDLPAVLGMPIHPYDSPLSPELSHLELRNSFMSHQEYRNWIIPMEAELAVLKDIGYNIDLRKHFGKSYYLNGDGTTPQYFDTGYSTWNGASYTSAPSEIAYGIGVHVYGDDNVIVQRSNILTSGAGSAGVRIEGVNNTYTVNGGSQISTNGENNIGILTSWGKEHTINIENNATVKASGEKGIGASFDFGKNMLGQGTQISDKGSYMNYAYVGGTGYNLAPDKETTGALVDDFNIKGTLEGNDKAIYISENAYVKNINVFDGAEIKGDIVSEWNSLKGGQKGIISYKDGETWKSVASGGLEKVYYTNINYKEGYNGTYEGTINGDTSTTVGETPINFNTLKINNEGTPTFKDSTIKVFDIINNGNINIKGNVNLSTKNMESSVTGSGNIVIDSAGSLNLSKNVQNIANNVEIKQNGILSTINDTQDTHTISKVSAANGAKVAFDVGDKLNISDVSNTQGTQIFSSIKTDEATLNQIIEQGEGYTKDLFQDKTLDFGSGIFNIYHDGKKYTLAQNSADKTKLVVVSAGEPASGLNAAAGDSSTGNYIVAQDEIQEYNGGEVVGDSFEVSGADLDFNTYKGLIVDGAKNTNGTTIKTNAFNTTSDANYKGTFTVSQNGKLTIDSSDKAIEIKGTNDNDKNALYIDATSNVTLNSANNNEVKITGNIQGVEGAKLNTSGNTVSLNTVKDTQVNQNANILNMRALSSNTTWTLGSGVMNVVDDSYISGDSSNSLVFNGGGLNLQNNQASQINLSSMEVNSASNLAIDVDMATQTADRFAFSAPNDLAVTSTLNINDVNLMNANQVFNRARYEIPFVSSSLNNQALLGKVQSSVNKQILTPILKYNFGYEEEGEEGRFVMMRSNTGKYQDYNPSVMAAPVAAQLGGYFNQLNSYDMAFSNMDVLMNMPSKDRTAFKFRNRYAANSENITYDPNLYPEQDRGVWFRPYSTFEKVNLKGGVKVDNIGYGTYFGGDSDLIELGHGWDAVFSGYAGYNGSHQNYDFISTYQNGGQLGASSIFYRNNFFTGLTANVGALGAQSSTMYGQDNFGMLGTGVASKTGYNFEFKEGRFIIQPSYLMSYSFVNTFDYTNSAGVRIKADPLNAIQIVPGLKFIANTKRGWQPYLAVQMVWNILDDTKFKANNVSLAQLSVKPYIQYGIGIQKAAGERFTGYLQSMFRNGGRNGVALSAGCRWALGR